MADITETVPFNFNEIYASIQEKFLDKGYDVEEGSNTAQLITAMAYLTSMLNVNTAVNINETLLPLATKRTSAMQDARVLGYEVPHKQSYEYRLTLQFTAGNHTIPKYTSFTYDGKTYYFLGNSIELKNVAEGYTIQINVKEGTLYKFEDYQATLSTTTDLIEDSNGNLVPQYYVDIPYIDVERSGLEVFLTYYDDSGNLFKREQWYQSKQFMVDVDTVLNKEYIRIDNIDYSTPRIYFKLSGVGTNVRVGTVVEINVLTTSGTEGGISDITNAAGIKHTLPNITVTNISLLMQGSDVEELEDIKLNASMFYNSANRAVTKQDYVAISNRHQAVKTSMVWGGDDEFPKCPGHIWFSFLPSANVRNHNATDEYNVEYNIDNPEDLINWYIENTEIRSVEYTTDGQLINPGVWDVLDRYKIPTLEFHNRHPIYLDFEYNLEILKYNIKTSKADIHQDVFNVINNYFTGVNEDKPIEDFEIEYFHSSLEKRIDNNLSDITGFNNSITTKIMLSKNNIAIENVVPDYRDIFIPLSIPFENYFDTDGELIISKLPSIDTNQFIEGLDLYTDWSGLSGKQSNKEIIIVPIRGRQTEEIISNNGQDTFTLTTIQMHPDDVTAEVLTYNGVIVKVDGVILEQSEYEINSSTQIELNDSLTDNQVLEITVNNQLGVYYIFNAYRKFILIQLYVNAVGSQFDGPIENNYAEPKSYLTTNEGFYFFTNDTYYLTTEGYAVVTEDSLSAITGPIIRTIKTALYTSSSLTLDHFDNVKYLNFNYASPNFKTIRNVIPRLRKVTFQ